MRSRLVDQISSSTSRGSRPLVARVATPAAIRRLSPATRTMKNSSRLLAKIARIPRPLEQRDRWRPRPSRARGWLKSSQLVSRSRNRSEGSACLSLLPERVGAGRGRRGRDVAVRRALEVDPALRDHLLWHVCMVALLGELWANTLRSRLRRRWSRAAARRRVRRSSSRLRKLHHPERGFRRWLCAISMRSASRLARSAR